MKSLFEDLKYIKQKISKKDNEATEVELGLTGFINKFIPGMKLDDVVREFKIDKHKLSIYTKHKLFSQEFNLELDNLRKFIPKKIEEIIIK